MVSGYGNGYLSYGHSFVAFSLLWIRMCVCKYGFYLFLAHMKEILEKEATENAAAKFEEEKRQQMQQEQDKMQRKQIQKQEEMLQARRKADEGM
jgi:DNA-binding transcriptional MerR regulator